MAQNKLHMRLISRRESIKVCLAPAGVIVGGWLAGCSSAEPAVATNPADTAPPSTAQTTSATPSTAISAAGTAARPTGGTPARAAASPANAGAGGAAATTPPSASPAMANAGAQAPSAAGTAASSSAGAGGMSASASAGHAAGASAAGSTGSGVAGPNVMWATGGTKAMQGGYDDPFAANQGGTACTLYPSQTLGPCYVNMPEMREDISDGATGLPLRLSFLVVRGNCEPIAGASVDIWHSGFDGVYSGYSGNTVCNPGSEDVTPERFCRGTGVTNETGRVHFSTIFPGWYSGRSVHIHFTVRINGTEEVTSQLYFEDDLTTEIQAQGEYKARGMRATTNATDFLFTSGGADPDQVILSTAKRPDGALHAWKILSIG